MKALSVSIQVPVQNYGLSQSYCARGGPFCMPMAGYMTIYIYCPVWRETWRFVQPRKFMSPEGEARGRHEFSGLNKSSCLPTNWAINCLLYRKLKEDFLSRKHALNRNFAYFGLHSQWVRLGAQNMYYDVIVLAAAAQCRETRQGDTTFWGRHDVLFSLNVTALDQSYFFIRRVDFMRYNNKCSSPVSTDFCPVVLAI